MKRVVCLSCCAVIALSIVSTSTCAQDDPFGESLIAKQAQAGEKSMLAAAESDGTDSAHNFCQCVGESESPSVAKIERALRSELKGSGIDYTDTTLEEVAADLEQAYGIPIEIDTHALDEIGIGQDQSVTASLHNISLRAALKLMLKQIQLTYIIRDEVLMITTPEEAEGQLLTCVYDVREMSDVSRDQFIEQLIDTVASCVATKTWRENGGAAAVRPLKPGLLVISQTRAVHDEIRALLTTIRDMRQKSRSKDDVVEKSAAVAPDADKIVTRFYLLQMGEAANPEAVRQQIRNLITTSLPDEQWAGQLENGQPVLLSVLPDRVVLRHKPAVQEQVRSLLADSGVATAATTANGEMGSGGFEGRFGGEFGRGAYGGYGRGGYGGESFGHGVGEGAYGGGFAGRGEGEVVQPQPSDNE